MADYIDREAAVRVIQDQHVGGKEGIENALPNTFGADLREIIYEIDQIPAARVAPVHRAKWIPDKRTGEWYCSRCKRVTEDRHDEAQLFEGREVLALCLPRYCGFCGARMRDWETGERRKAGVRHDDGT